MTIPQAPPPPPAGFQPSENTGALLRFVVHSYNPQSVTPFGVKSEVVVDVDVIADSEQAGEGFTQIKLSGKALAPQLGQVVGQEVFGRLAAKPGQNANPAMWLDVLRPGDEAIIERWRSGMRAATTPTHAPRRQPDYRNEPAWQDDPARPSDPPHAPPQDPATQYAPPAGNGAPRAPEPAGAPTYRPPTYGSDVPLPPEPPDEPPY